MEFLIVWLLIFAIVAIHAFYALEKTSQQRLDLLVNLRDYQDPDNWGKRLRDFGRVDFDAHLFRLLTFRDPWTIYPDELANLMRVAT